MWVTQSKDFTYLIQNYTKIVILCKFFEIGEDNQFWTFYKVTNTQIKFYIRYYVENLKKVLNILRKNFFFFDDVVMRNS